MFALSLPFFLLCSCATVNAVMLKNPTLIEKISKDKVQKLADRELILHPEPAKRKIPQLILEKKIATMVRNKDLHTEDFLTKDSNPEDFTEAVLEQIQLASPLSPSVTNYTGNHSSFNITEAPTKAPTPKPNPLGIMPDGFIPPKTPEYALGGGSVFAIIIGVVCFCICGMMAFNAMSGSSGEND